jgi:hypothetical protein
MITGIIPSWELAASTAVEDSFQRDPVQSHIKRKLTSFYFAAIQVRSLQSREWLTHLVRTTIEALHLNRILPPISEDL